MRITKISILFLAILGISGCSTANRYGFFKDETQSYRKAPVVEGTVVIPQNLSSNGMQDYYEVPQPAADASNMQPPIAPPGSNIGQAGTQPVVLSQQDRIRNAENAKIQGHTSPTANGPKPIGLNFSQAWVKASHVLQASNYKIVEKDQSMGTYFVIDTSRTGGKVKKDMPIYQVHLKPSGNGTIVSVTPSNQNLQNQLYHFLND